MIRISSQQIFSSGISRLQDLNASLQQTSQQVSTGKRVNQPSDDPVAAARILKLDQEVARIEQFQRNAGLAENRLQEEENAISSMLDVVQRVRELTGRTRGPSMERMASELGQYLQGWLGCLGKCETPTVLESLGEWFRRRLRSAIWKQWKRGRTRFAELDPRRQYLLYCDKGIMSRLQASHLRDAGYQNVAVYRP